MLLRIAAVLITLVVFSSLGCDLPKDHNHDGVIKIVTIGDSNSDGTSDWPGLLALMLAQTRPTWQVVNYARSGATVTDSQLWPYWWFQTQVDLALADPIQPDLVMIAGGTNDARGNTEGGVVIDKLFSLKEQIDSTTAFINPDGSTTTAITVIATVPTMYSSQYTDPEPWDAGRTEEYTGDIIASFPAVNVMDFRTIVTQADYLTDGIHFTTEGGQLKRAQAAYRKLTGGQNPPAIQIPG